MFEVVDRPHWLVTRSTGSSPDGASLDNDIEITFREEGNKTLMTIVHRGFPSENVRDFFANEAWIGFFDRLAAYFEAKAAK